MPNDRAACGMGFVATPQLGHESVSLGVHALARLSHRGGLDADGKSGDGAGLLIQVPHRLVGGEVGVAVLFEWDQRARTIVADVWHGLVAKPDLDGNEWEQRLYLARRRIERRAAEEGVRMYLPSLSSRTVVYKGLMAGTRLADFYLDLR